MLCAGLLITGRVDVARHTEAWLDLEVGCRVGDVARDHTCPFATRPPATLLSTRFACVQGKGTTGRGGGGGLRGNGRVRLGALPLQCCTLRSENPTY